MIKSKKRILVRVLFALFAGVFLAGAFATPASAREQGYNTQVAGNLDNYINEAKSFKWWEEPFNIVKEAVIDVGESTFAKVAGGVPELIFTGWLLWLVTFMMTQLASLKEVDPMEMLTKVGGMMFKGMFAYALVTQQAFFFGYFVSPIIATAAGFVGIDAGAGEGLQSVVSPLQALMDDMHNSIAQGIGIGDYAMDISWWQRLSWPFEDLFEKEGVRDGYPEFEVWGSGCIVYLGCWILFIVFPFFVFDAMIRLGVTAALCPLFIAAWVFPITVGFAKKGFQSILNVAFLFVCLKIILDLDVQLLLGASGMDAKLASAADPNAFMDKIVEGNNVLIAFVCVFYSVLFTLQATQLSNFFADTQFENNTAWQATQYAGGTVAKAASATAGVAGWAGRRAMTDIDRAAARSVERGRQKREKDTAMGRTPSAPSFKEKMASKYLQKRGFVDKNGRYKEGMEGLLTNGWRRDAKKFAAQGMNKASSWVRKGFLKSEADIDKQSEALEKKITAKEKENPNYDQTKEGKKDYEKLMRYDRQKTELQNSGNKYTSRNWLGKTWLGKGIGKAAGGVESAAANYADKKRNLIDDVPDSAFAPPKGKD